MTRQGLENKAQPLEQGRRGPLRTPRFQREAIPFPEVGTIWGPGNEGRNRMQGVDLTRDTAERDSHTHIQVFMSRY